MPEASEVEYIFAALGIFPYHNFRSQSEQAMLREQAWARAALPDDLLKDAYHLAGRGGKKPKAVESPTRPVESDLRNLIAAFTELQKDRYDADYNVGKAWSRTEVPRTLDVADKIFKTWQRVGRESVAQDHLLSMFGAGS